jgi:hypothetical protein
MMKFKEIPINYVAEISDDWGQKTKITIDRNGAAFLSAEGG